MSELRQDLITGDWVIISPNRRRRPHEFASSTPASKPSPVKNCPFENPQKSGNKPPSIIWPNLDNWRLQVIPNKYPALSSHSDSSTSSSIQLPFLTQEAKGFHDLIITRSHTDNFPKLSKFAAANVLKAAQSRFLAYQKTSGTKYGFLFHNWGHLAGASVYHPHYQLLGLPILPPHLESDIRSAANYFRKHRRYPYSDLIKAEIKHRRRIIAENDSAIAFTRFASKEPFDFRVFPKFHEPYFESSNDKIITAVAAVLKKSLSLLESKLKCPNYNFFLHSAPLKNQSRFNFYHWHIDVVPKLSISGGVEVGTGLEITTVDPDEAAAFLKS